MLSQTKSNTSQLRRSLLDVGKRYLGDGCETRPLAIYALSTVSCACHRAAIGEIFVQVTALKSVCPRRPFVRDRKSNHPENTHIRSNTELRRRMVKDCDKRTYSDCTVPKLAAPQTDLNDHMVHRYNLNTRQPLFWLQYYTLR